MKKVLFASLIMAVSVAVSVAASNASDSLLTDTRLGLIRSQIEVQIERTQRACERAQTRISLARMRAEEQLRIAEEDLMLQVERLEMLREQLRDQAGESEYALVQSEQNWKRILERDVEKICGEIRKANDLIRKLRMWRENSSADTANSKSAGAVCSERSSQNFSTESKLSTSGLGGWAGRSEESPSLAELEAMLEKIQQEQSSQRQPAPIVALPPPPIVRTG